MLTLDDAIRVYLDQETPQALLDVLNTINSLEDCDRWERISAMAKQTDHGHVLIDVLFWPREADNDDNSKWYNIDNRVYPFCELISNSCGNEAEMIALANSILVYVKAYPDRRNEIAKVLQAYEDSIDLYEEEAKIYAKII